ncbi:hypothetical protein PVAP13_8KG098936 [Panicum virgatum]|uniref:Uncharacterized protein n=1 Tax=Panicum virgatum TaxID=38727 RepID=A0A8T0PI07_PANVG|nr:hypothetical protein PVAP13_8KG098936 [Panicum virgatum]
MLMLSSQAYTSIKRLACHWVIERVEQFLMLWLQDVVEGLGATTFVARQELVRQPDIKRVHISFQIPVRHAEWTTMVPGSSSTIPMVSITVVGGEANIWTTYERLAVEACLQQLKNHGYFVPDFSYF